MHKEWCGVHALLSLLYVKSSESGHCTAADIHVASLALENLSQVVEECLPGVLHISSLFFLLLKSVLGSLHRSLPPSPCWSRISILGSGPWSTRADPDLDWDQIWLAQPIHRKKNGSRSAGSAHQKLKRERKKVLNTIQMKPVWSHGHHCHLVAVPDYQPYFLPACKDPIQPNTLTVSCCIVKY